MVRSCFIKNVKMRLASLAQLFGDPCPNRRKNLIINYEIHGAHGKLGKQKVSGTERGGAGGVEEDEHTEPLLN